MAHINNARPVNDLLLSSQSLREQTSFAHRQAATGASRASQAVAELAALDLEEAFRQLHQMVALIGGHSVTENSNVVAFSLDKAHAQAAE